MRNLLLTNNFEFEVMVDGKPKKVVATWNDVVAAHYIYTRIRKVGEKPKIKTTHAHVYRKKIKKMRVKHAVQVFSKSMAEFMREILRSKS